MVSSGGTVNVAKGTYNENLTIIDTKGNITLESISSADQTTIIGKSGPTFKITANNVTVNGFTIKSTETSDIAVYFEKVEGGNIKNNNFVSNAGDMWINNSSNISVQNNKFCGLIAGDSNVSDDYPWGIWITNSSGITISDNDITQRDDTLPIENSQNITIKDNIIHDNLISWHPSIYLSGVEGSTISGNTIFNNLSLGAISLNRSSKNTISNNQIKTITIHRIRVELSMGQE